MKQDNINYLLVGSFMIFISILFFTLLFFITGKIADADEYYTVLDDVTAVNEGSSVIYNGYKIGQISNILPVYENEKTRFKLTLKVKSGWKISKGSEAMIASKGLLSDAQISITEGSLPGLMFPGDTIKGSANTNIMMVMKSVGEQINTLSSDLIIPLVKQIKDDMGLFGKSINTDIPRLSKNINELVQKLQKNSESIDSLFAKDNQQNISATLANAGIMMQNLKESSLAISKIVNDNESAASDSVSKINRSISIFNNKLEQIMNQLETSSQNINAFSNQIKNNPGVILRNNPQTDPALR